jgi:DNA adenine methylase
VNGPLGALALDHALTPPATPVARPALRYYGSKWRLAPWIMAHFPPHTCYVEPYGGGANVLLRKPPAEFDVYNDADGEVVNFFTVLREQPAALLRAIRLTPYARRELERAYEPCEEAVERARRFYVRSWQAYHPGRPHMPTGWRRQYQNNRGKSVVAYWNDTGKLDAVVARFKHVQVECGEALDVIASYDGPETLFYVDPPYVQAARSDRRREKGYSVEMSDDDHRALAETLHAVEGYVVLSGYPSALYDALYPTWETVTRMASTNGNNRRKEVLWLAPRTVAALDAADAEAEQDLGPLFAQAGSGA